jgi:hypothetical protein
MLLFHPAGNACVLLVLPMPSLQLPDRLADSLLVLGVSKMRAQGAAAIVRAVGVDTPTAIAINTGPSRSEPGEVTAKHLAAVSWICELHERAGEADQHFGHAR